MTTVDPRVRAEVEAAWARREAEQSGEDVRTVEGDRPVVHG